MNHPNQSQELELFIEPLENRLLLSATGTETTYDQSVDPDVGFNIVSFSKQKGKEARTNWQNGIQSLYESGVENVTINVYREVKASNGRVIGSSGTGNDVLKVALQTAETLGMQVTINPLFEVVGGDDSWRGAFDPDGADAKRFHNSYKSWIRKLARTAEKFEVSQFHVGSELSALVSNVENAGFFTETIETADKFYSGDIGYVANWANLDNSILANVVWDNEIIDFVGVSAYFSGDQAVVDVDAAANSSENPNFVDDVQAGWEFIIDNTILPVAANAHDGAGLPVVIAEFGAVPFDMTSINPWSTTPGEYLTGNPGESIDSAEQTALIDGLLRALDGRRDEITGVNFWTWTFEGNPNDTFGLGPNAAAEAQQATDLILGFVNGSNE